MTDAERRTSDLAAALQEMRAVDAERRLHMDRRFDAIEKMVKEQSAHVVWLVRLVIGAVVGAFITFLLSGGLNVIG